MEENSVVTDDSDSETGDLESQAREELAQRLLSSVNETSVQITGRRFSGLSARRQYAEFSHWRDAINQKVLADRLLSEEAARRAEEQEQQPVFSQEDVDQAKAAGYEEGKQQGRQEGDAQGYQRGWKEGKVAGIEQTHQEKQALLQQATANLCDQMRLIGGRLDEMRDQLSIGACVIALEMMSRVWSTIDRAVIQRELERMTVVMVRDVIPQGVLKVWVNSQIDEEARKALIDTARSAGYMDDLTVLADASLSLGDVRFEWDGGTLERSHKKMIEEIRRSVAHATGLAEADLVSALSDQEERSGAQPSSVVRSREPSLDHQASEPVDELGE